MEQKVQPRLRLLQIFSVVPFAAFGGGLGEKKLWGHPTPRHRDGHPSTPPLLRFAKPGRLLWLPLVCLLMGVGIVACGNNAGVGAAGGTTPTAVPTTVPTSQVIGAEPKCGQIALDPSGQLVDVGKAQQVGDCFWQAFNQCKPASFIYAVGGVDTSMIRTFKVVKKVGGCEVSDALQHRIMPRPASTAVVYTCINATKSTGQISFQSCGVDGTVVVPLMLKTNTATN